MWERKPWRCAVSVILAMPCLSLDRRIIFDCNSIQSSTVMLYLADCRFGTSASSGLSELSTAKAVYLPKLRPAKLVYLPKLSTCQSCVPRLVAASPGVRHQTSLSTLFYAGLSCLSLTHGFNIKPLSMPGTGPSASSWLFGTRPYV